MKIMKFVSAFANVWVEEDVSQGDVVELVSAFDRALAGNGTLVFFKSNSGASVYLNAQQISAIIVEEGTRDDLALKLDQELEGL